MGQVTLCFYIQDVIYFVVFISAYFRSITRNKSHTTVTYFSSADNEIIPYLPTLAVIAPDLECVSFLGYLDVDQKRLSKFFKLCGNLHSVCIREMQSLTDDTIKNLVTFNKSLKIITLTQCTSLDCNSIPIIANTCCDFLERVDFSYNSKSFLGSMHIFEEMAWFKTSSNVTGRGMFCIEKCIFNEACH
jgi:hypothetical protein